MTVQITLNSGPTPQTHRGSGHHVIKAHLRLVPPFPSMLSPPSPTFRSAAAATPAMYRSQSYPDPFLYPSWAFQSSPPPHPHDHHHHRPPSPPPMASSPPSDSVGLLSSPTSNSPLLNSSFIQRSSSALSLHKHVLGINQHHYGGAGGSYSGIHLHERPDFFDFPSDGPIRRVFSTGDIRAMNSNLRPPGADNCALEIVGGNGTAMGGRVGRYNAEERRERIERYRNKRNQRNFQKKITYVCRKTLADSRPRIRGRFARNGDAELETDAEAGEVSSSSGGVDYRGWRPAVDGEDCSYDPDFWANFLDNLSVGNMIA